MAQTFDQSGRQLTDQQRDVLASRLVANADKLQRLLGDLLDVDRLTRGASLLDREPTDLAALVTRVVEGIDNHHGHRVHLDLEPVMANVDPAKIERVVENLVVNAFKHTPAGTDVRIVVDADDDQAMLEVIDAGPGVPDGLKPTIFEPFVQGPDSSKQASPGTGIGLALVARLVRLHDGDVWVEYAPGGGACFCVRLPRAAD